jgi:folate-binding protein YgfZ
MMNSWILLEDRCVIKLQGAQTQEMISGLTTAQLLENQASFTVMLSPQGRFAAEFFVIPLGDDAFALDLHTSHAALVWQTLDKVRLLHGVTMEHAPEYRICAALGPVAEGDFLAQQAPLMQWYADTRAAHMGQRALVRCQDLSHLPVTSMCPLPLSAYHGHRMRQGIAEGAYDLTPHSKILEWGYERMNAISWTKGCYMGQELMARMHHQNLIQRTLCLLESLDPWPQPGQRLMHQNKTIAIMGGAYGTYALASLSLNWLRQCGVISGEGSLQNSAPPERESTYRLSLKTSPERTSAHTDADSAVASPSIESPQDTHQEAPRCAKDHTPSQDTCTVSIHSLFHAPRES